MTNSTKVPEIKRTEIDPKAVKKFGSEADFVGLSLELLIETGSWLCVAGNLLPAVTEAWDRDQAVVGGHVVRLYKLISAMSDQTCQRRREISFILARLAFECIINLRFLIKNSSEEMFRAYRAYSLKSEKKLKDLTEKRINKRGGKTLAIEERILNSIAKSFDASGISPDEVIPAKLKNWGGKNIYEKAEELGLADAYIAAFGLASHGVHGNWQDLLEYQLDYDGTYFRPEFDWHQPRPQYLNVIAMHAIQATFDYLRWLAGGEIEELQENLKDLYERVSAVDKLHEQFLANSAGKDDATQGESKKS
jgi:phage gpG-like protein